MINIFFPKSLSAGNDYSIVEHEFSRFFVSQKSRKSDVGTKPCSIFKNENILLPIIDLFSRNQEERSPERDKTELSLESCRNVHLICGEEGREQDCLLSKLEQPFTETGIIFLAGLLTNPIHDPKKLKRRADLIRLFSGDQNLCKQLTGCISKFKEPISTIISIKTSDYKNDSSCLLNNLFTFYWQNKSFVSFIPKKIRNLLKDKNNESEKGKKIKRRPFENLIDKNNFLLNISVASTALVMTIAWFAEISSLIKSQGDIFNIFQPIKQFCFGPSYSKDNLDAAETKIGGDIKNIISKDALTSDEQFNALTYLQEAKNKISNAQTQKKPFTASAKWVYESTFRPEFRAEVDYETTQLKNPRTWLTTGPKMLKRVIKPIYVLLAPIIIISNAIREFNLYKIAISRAKKEIAEMENLIKLFEQLIQIIEEHCQNHPQTAEIIEELDLFFHIKNLIKHCKNDEFGHLITSLKDGTVKTPGRFLRMYKELYLSIDRFRFALEALGQLDAFLSISRLSTRPEFCFTQFIENSDLPEIEANNFWDPQIGNETSITNSIKIGPQARGMIITGSNASGKSTFMRGVFRGSMMAQSIILVPAESFKLTPFKETFTLMSKKDDPPNRSQFRVEADLISQFLKKTEGGCFMLSAIDEMFNTTGSQDCQALTRAIIEHLSTKQKTITLISTHNPQITKAEADSGNVFKNYKITAKRDNFGHFAGYCRKISQGVADSFDSTALDVALLAGIDGQIVNRARQLKQEISILSEK